MSRIKRSALHRCTHAHHLAATPSLLLMPCAGSADMLAGTSRRSPGCLRCLSASRKCQCQRGASLGDVTQTGGRQDMLYAAARTRHLCIALNTYSDSSSRTPVGALHEPSAAPRHPTTPDVHPATRTGQITLGYTANTHLKAGLLCRAEGTGTCKKQLIRVWHKTSYMQGAKRSRLSSLQREAPVPAPWNRPCTPGQAAGATVPSLSDARRPLLD